MLVRKKDFQNCNGTKIKLNEPGYNLKKRQKGIKSINGKNVLQNLKIFWFWTMGVLLSFYNCTFVSLEEKKLKFVS